MRNTNFRRLSAILVLLVISAISLSTALTAVRADDSNAVTVILTNLRKGAGTQYDVVGTLQKSTPVVIEGRTADMSWILVHTPDNAARGWGKTTLFNVSPNLKLSSIYISEEILGTSSPAVAPNLAPAPKNLPSGEVTSNAVPVISPRVRAAMRAIYRRGLTLGNNPRVFSKVGDCHTDHPAFFDQFGTGSYNLGDYGSLQEVIEYFSVSPRPGAANSFITHSQAAHSAFTSEIVLEGVTFTNPDFCQAGEIPLACEYRIDKPSVSIIMFGVVDVLLMTPQQFNHYMRYIVKDTMDRGIVPILSTAAENSSNPTRSQQFNQIVARIANEKSIPLINLNAALATLPNKGMDPDGIHLSRPADVSQTGFFTGENLQYGYTMRNLVTLQALQQVMHSILN